MESLKGTPFFGQVRALLTKEDQGQLTLMNSQLNEIFSFRRRPVEWADPRCFEQVAEAVYERQQITFYYTKQAHPQGEQRVVNPCHLVCMDDIWYLLAFDIRRQDMRTFALTRIENVERTGLGFEAFDTGVINRLLHDAFGLMGKNSRSTVQTVRLQFNAFAATRIRERKWHDSQRETPLPDGGIELSFRLAQLSEVLEWILSWGEHVRVCEPQELIDRLKQRLQTTLAQYSHPPEK
jgi:predicted DNA-binding transcriptional regulator YafY